MKKNVAKPVELVTVRQMREEDLDGVLAINAKLQGETRAVTYAPVPDSCIGGEVANSIVAVEDGKVAGFVLGRVARSPMELCDVAWIEMIGIDPQYQRHGIGTKLLESWKEQCRKQGIKKVHVMIYWRDSWMLSFFESVGFSQGDLTDYQIQL